MMQDVTIFRLEAPDQRETLPGRLDGTWILVNTGRHTKWGLYDAETGLRLVHAAPTLRSVQALLHEIRITGLELEPVPSWDGPVWGKASSYTSASIREIGILCRKHQEMWA